MERRLHTIGLLLLMIVLSVSLLGVLGAVTASSDLALAERHADYVRGQQDCTNQAHRWMSELSLGGPLGELLERDFSDGNGHLLSLTLQREPEGFRIMTWIYRTVREDSAIENLYQPKE